ncbi:MAG: helix-turn-helix domain-containing protein [Coriobacteriia bacterium]|nr:helix-turn-helix domain-containing protein [Coriobacteriia bacterium]
MKRRIIDVEDFGQIVKAARKQQGSTQKELSDFFSAFSREFLSDLENGKPTIELGKALAAAHALGLHLYLESNDQSDRRSHS